MTNAKNIRQALRAILYYFGSELQERIPIIRSNNYNKGIKMKILKLIILPVLMLFCLTSATAYASGAIGSFSTKFNLDNTPRVNNLKTASIAIDGTIVQPGQVFSYNETVGPTTQARGYQKSKIFVNGKEKQGYGGGVCQVSSTLYNAAMDAGLEIIERHQHSKDVAYIGKNKDAATSYGVIDLKFKNTLHHPIQINSYIQDNTLYIDIFGA